MLIWWLWMFWQKLSFLIEEEDTPAGKNLILRSLGAALCVHYSPDVGFGGKCQWMWAGTSNFSL